MNNKFSDTSKHTKIRVREQKNIDNWRLWIKTALEITGLHTRPAEIGHYKDDSNNDVFVLPTSPRSFDLSTFDDFLKKLSDLSKVDIKQSDGIWEEAKEQRSKDYDKPR